MRHQPDAEDAHTRRSSRPTEGRVKQVLSRKGARNTDLHTCAWRYLALIGLLIGPTVAAQTLPVSGTISYLGTQGPVSATRPIQVAIFNKPIGAAQNKPLSIATVPTSPGNFTFQVSAGTYYLAYYLAVMPDGTPDIGEPFQLYNHQLTPPGTALTVSGSGFTGLNLAFDDSGVLSGIAGTVTYTGSLGSVYNNSRLIVERFSDPSVAGPEGDQNTVKSNGSRYNLVTFDTGTWYLVAYLDLNNSRVRDAGEPFTIYNGKRTPPADPVKASTTQTSIAITFGDENVGSVATPTPTPSPSAPPIPTPTPTTTPTVASTPVPCVGDCDGSGDVQINEIIQCVNIALGTSSLSACTACDADGDGQVEINEIISAVNNALNGCGG